MTKSQTALEYLLNELTDIIGELNVDHKKGLLVVDAIEKAKQMEKEQMKDAYWNGSVDIAKSDALSLAEEWFNETYTK
jgi:hypothetical protein